MANVHQIAVAVKAVDKTTKPLRSIARRLVKMKGPVGQLARGFQKLSTSTRFRALISKIKKLARITRNTAKKIRSSLKWAAAGFGILAAGATAALMKITASADRIGKVSDKIGITTTELQKLRFAAEQSGLKTEELDRSMEKFSRSIGQARQKTGAQRDAFNDLGISLHDSTGKAKTTTQLMAEVADAMAKIEDPTVKARIANDLFGRSGVGLLNMLKGGRKGLQDYGRQLEEAGGVQSDKFIRASEAFNDSINKTRLALLGLTSKVLTPLIPKLTDLVDRFRQWAVSVKPELVEKFQTALQGLGRFVKGVALGFKDLVSVVGEWWNSIKALFPVEQKWTDNWAKVTDKFKVFEDIGRKVIPIIGAIVAAMAVAKVIAFASSLSMLLSPIGLIVVAAGALIAAIYAVYKNWDKILAYLKGQWEQFKTNLLQLWEDIKTALISVWDGIKAALSAAWEGLKKILSFHPLALIVGNWGPILNFFTDLWDKVKNMAGAAWDALGNIIRKAVKKMVGWMPDWVQEKLGFKVEGDKGENRPVEDPAVTQKIIKESTRDYKGIPGMPQGGPSANSRAQAALDASIRNMNNRAPDVANKEKMKGELVVAFRNPPAGLRVQGATVENLDIDVHAGPTDGYHL